MNLVINGINFQIDIKLCSIEIETKKGKQVIEIKEKTLKSCLETIKKEGFLSLSTTKKLEVTLKKLKLI